MPPDDLSDPDQDGWTQLSIEFPAWPSAEAVVAEHLRPMLGPTGWWFIRKHPYWRIRCRTDICPAAATALDRLSTGGTIAGWHRTIYEPEALAFGGHATMTTAHTLFHHDSRTVIDVLHAPPRGLPRRRELTVLAVGALLRGAGQDWFEQGDIWAKVASLRPPGPACLRVAPRAPAALHRLMTLDAGQALAPLDDWLEAFTTAGHDLAALARTGRLERGLRAVLAHHVIFHWNRLGLTAAEQHVLATLARDTVMNGGTS
jgi:protein-L-isoaspartate(D-aspartate) O-methyltransferase